MNRHQKESGKLHFKNQPE